MNKLRNLVNLRNIYMYILCIIIGGGGVILRYPLTETKNYICADATWHTLLTIKAYDETLITIHKFLPIVTLGQPEDKNIPWGATIPDQYGNYYYTSFSPLGYAAPWLFMKIFNLPINEQSLYIFNSILYLISFLLLALLLVRLFFNEMPKELIILLSGIYLFQPEILHSQGIVYWHQSLFQVLFLLQLLLFTDMRGRFRQFAFFVLCIVMPYLEWTGFVSNIGFAIALFFRKGVIFNRAEITIKTERILKCAAVILCTIASAVIFVKHYLTTVSSADFWRVINSRYNARTGALLSQIGKGYLDSFGLLILTVVILLITILLIQQTRKAFVECLNGKEFILFVMLFALIENLIMKQHAVQYTFDRMKGAFPLIFMLTISVAAIYKCMVKKNAKSVCYGVIVATVLILCGISLGGYIIDNSHWKWDAPYLENNRIVANELADKYTRANSIFLQNTATRGYTNLLFKRGVYEGISQDRGYQLAIEKGKRYAVVFQVNGGAWNMYDYSHYTVIDTEAITTANMTDNNWTNGVATFGNILLFPNNGKYKELLLQSIPQTVTANSYTAEITEITERDAWIWVKIADSADKDKFQFPVELIFN